MVPLSRIAPEIPVSNLQRSIAYYQQKLGFHVAMQMPDGAYAIVERDDIAIHLFQDETQNHSSVGIHVFADDLDGLLSELQNRGATVTQPIQQKQWGTRDFRVQDDSGNILKFTEPLAENF